jgi:hypothetical protein
MLCSICNEMNQFSLSISAASSSKLTPFHESRKLQHTKSTKGQISRYEDIFRIRASALNGCELCTIVIQAFESWKIKDENRARGLPVVLSVRNFKFTFAIENPEDSLPIEICTFDVYLYAGTSLFLDNHMF